MARLSVTLDDEATRELSDLRVEEWRATVHRAMEVLPADEAMYVIRLSRSLDELGGSPSVAAVMRQALDLYFGLLDEARSSVALRAGYMQLAADSERQEIVDVMSKRAPEHWNDEA
jgi:hypothetical protein